MQPLNNPAVRADGTPFSHVKQNCEITLRRNDSKTGMYSKVSIARLDANRIRLKSRDYDGTKSVVVLDLSNNTAELIKPLLGIDAQVEVWTSLVIEQCVEALEYYE